MHNIEALLRPVSACAETEGDPLDRVTDIAPEERNEGQSLGD
jgi:hypothetical protein